MYIRFTKMHNILDPCGCQSGCARIIACFIEQLMFDHNSCSATVLGYVEAINTLFRLSQFDIPADLLDQSNMCSKIILARDREENVARQKSNCTRDVFCSVGSGSEVRRRFARNSCCRLVHAHQDHWTALL